MDIGQVIRRYRKMKNMTQEEMANRLGVSGPAVNKWEKGNSFPDITLLAPIARLLDITPDVLLSFREELTQEEMEKLTAKADEMLRRGSYGEAFLWAKEKVEEYPNCESLMANMAILLYSHGMIKGICTEEYDQYIGRWLRRALESRDEEIRTMAANGLFGFYRRKEEYEKAEECLAFFSKQNLEKKRKLAQLCALTGRKQEAYRIYEGLLFSAYQMVIGDFYGIYKLAAEDGDMEKARRLAEKMRELAAVFDMGEYYETVPGLDLAMLEEDKDRIADLVGKMLSDVDNIGSWSKSFLYEHMEFKQIGEEFLEKIRQNLAGMCEGQMPKAAGWAKPDKEVCSLNRKL